MFGSAIFAGLPISGSSVSGISFTGSNTIQLVEDRANEVSIPAVTDGGVHTRLMEWDDLLNMYVASVNPTRVSEFVKQLNRRYVGSSALNGMVVTRCETVDAETGNRYVFTPGATPAGSLQDFQVIIPDQLGGFESRGFLLYLAPNANPNAFDGGEVLLRVLPSALPW
jgi:hypothetical protein